MVKNNHLGIKISQGWYIYEANNPYLGIPNPLILDLVSKYKLKRKPAGDSSSITAIHVNPKKSPKRKIKIKLSKSSLAFYCMLMLINEGYKILDEGLINTEEEVDLLWIYGYAYPNFRGGPLFTAKYIFGLKKCLYALQNLHSIYPYRRIFQPAKYLVQRVNEHQNDDGFSYNIYKSKL